MTCTDCIRMMRYDWFHSCHETHDAHIVVHPWPYLQVPMERLMITDLTSTVIRQYSSSDDSDDRYPRTG